MRRHAGRRGAAATRLIAPAQTVCPIVRADRALLGPDASAADVVLHLNGATIGAVDVGRPHAEAAGRLALPAPANAHDHLRALRSVALGGWDLPFELWTLAQGGAPAVDPGLAALVALGRSALGGAGGVMVHYTRPQGGRPLEREAQDVCRAARQVGVRIAFAVALRDRNALAYGGDEAILSALPEALAERARARAAAPAPEEQIELVRRVAEACADDLVEVQFGPVGPQWCSDALLRAIARAAERDGRRIHMHLLETRAQREWADAHHPEGLLTHLDRLGLLSERLCVAHAVWARPAELELMAARGVRMVTNPSSNLVLASGVAPVAAALRAGVRVGVGLDGLSLDEDDDVLRELRLAFVLHKGVGFERALTQADVFAAACGESRAGIAKLAAEATLAPGSPADVLVLDRQALARDVLAASVGDLDLVFARARKEHVLDLIVAGRYVVRDRRLVGLDLRAAEEELLAQARRGQSAHARWQEENAPLKRLVREYYEQRRHCCG